MILLSLLLAAQAHRLDPGVLGLREVAEGRYVIRWQPPPADPDQPMPSLDCRADEMVWDCGVEGPSRIDGGGASVLVVIEGAAGQRSVQILSAAAPVWQRRSPPGLSAWLPMGLRHALTGADHMLFVGGLVVLVERLRPLLLTVTAFTVAHSLTLAASALSVLVLPSAPVEACIALSLVLLAVELTRPERSGPPWRMAAAFGLLHGFGFAGALTAVGLPSEQQGLALLGFNLGVELAQVLVVLCAFLPARWLRRKGWQRGVAWIIGPLGVAWTLERIAAF